MNEIKIPGDKQDTAPQSSRLREVERPSHEGENLIEKGSRGVVRDDIDREDPPIKMKPKNTNDSASPTPGDTGKPS